MARERVKMVGGLRFVFEGDLFDVIKFFFKFILEFSIRNNENYENYENFKNSYEKFYVNNQIVLKNQFFVS
jgi:hypothetical protein